MKAEENENNLTVMVLDGKFKYYQKKDADILLNSLEKEIEELREENNNLHKEYNKAVKDAVEVLGREEDKKTKLKERVKELEDGMSGMLNDVKEYIGNYGDEHIQCGYIQVCEKLLTK